MPPDVDYAIAHPCDNQGIEWRPTSSVPVAPGAYSGTFMGFDQAGGRGAWIQTPYWASGQPGTKVRLVLENWPAGYQTSFYGDNQMTPGTVRDWPFYLESDGTTFSTTLTVPATTLAGYDYEIHTYRYDDPQSYLDLTTYFQVCTLKSSRASVRSGGTVRLSGVIPTQGHEGSRRGKVKYVTLYEHARRPVGPDGLGRDPRGLGQAEARQGRRLRQVRHVRAAHADDLARRPLPGRRLVLRRLHVGAQGPGVLIRGGRGPVCDNRPARDRSAETTCSTSPCSCRRA